jgi:hypothetical protein
LAVFRKERVIEKVLADLFLIPTDEKNVLVDAGRASTISQIDTNFAGLSTVFID